MDGHVPMLDAGAQGCGVLGLHSGRTVISQAVRQGNRETADDLVGMTRIVEVVVALGQHREWEEQVVEDQDERAPWGYRGRYGMHSR